ncbi:MAG: S-layer homology domain-containing protein [Clostridia bacterium]|nr:S-layer homology domain-containing protein [Clostridia bacterium]
MKRIISLIISLILLMPTYAYAYDVEIVSKSAVCDPVNELLILSGNINIGGDRPILIEIYDKDGELAGAERTMSNSEGDFVVNIGTTALTGDNYEIWGSYRDKARVKLYTLEGMSGIEAKPIAAQVDNGYVFMANETDVDSEFSSVKINLNNAQTVLGTVSGDNYTVTGMPAGITAELEAISAKTLRLNFMGKAADAVTEEYDISVKLKSGIIISGAANTNSAEIKGITLYPYEYGKKVNTDKNKISFAMSSYKTPSNSSVEAEILYRNITKQGILVKGEDFDYDSLALNGMKITASANKEKNSILLTLSGSADSNITKELKVDLVLKAKIAENAGFDSDAITVSVTPASQDKGGSSTGNSGGNSGGGGGNSVIQTPSVVKTEPIIPVITATLTDIEYHWSRDYVQKLNNLGFVKGYKDNTYRPDEKITRAEFVTLILRILGKENTSYKGAFSDVSTEDWYCNSVQTALDRGLISRDEKFRPNDYIRRDEIVKIAALAYLKDHTAPDLNVSMAMFSDSSEIEDWAKEYIQVGLNLGIVSGYDDGKFHAERTATRGETAAILARLIDCINM